MSYDKDAGRGDLSFPHGANAPEADNLFDNIQDVDSRVPDIGEINAAGGTEAYLKAKGIVIVPTGHLMDPEWRTELSNSRRLLARHVGKFRYVAPWKKFLVWDGRIWKLDTGVAMEAFARDVATEVWEAVKEEIPSLERGDQLMLLNFAKTTASANGMAHTLSLVRSEENVVIDLDKLDSDPWLLNTQNATIDLRTGKPRSHNKADLITKISPTVFKASATSPTWLAFLERIVPDDEVRGFLQRLAGYWLTATTREHILPIFVGPGANGKSVYLNTIMAVLGIDYACQAPPDLLVVKKSQHPTELAMLHGKRLVCAIETGEDNKLDEPKVKMLTGGEQITARRCNEDFWTFPATHKHAIGTNYLPKVNGSDGGIWRRLRKIVFGIVIPPEEQDKELPEKLLKESSGILNWMIAGCLEWQAKGLNEPAIVMEETGKYRRGENNIQRFIDEQCLISSGISTGAGQLFKAYAEWCEESNEEAETQNKFGRRMNDLGFVTDRGLGGRTVRHGIGLKATE